MKRLLLVDDDAMLLKAMSRQLSLHFLVTVATGPLVGLELVRAETFDAVISDHEMPEMMGDAFLEQVRELQPGAKRLLMSGGTKADVSGLLSRGVIHHFLAKPFTPEQAQAALAEPTVTWFDVPDFTPTPV